MDTNNDNLNQNEPKVNTTNEPQTEPVATPYVESKPNKPRKSPSSNDLHVHFDSNNMNQFTNTLTKVTTACLIGLLGVTLIQSYQTKMLRDQNTEILQMYEKTNAQYNELLKSYADTIDNLEDGLNMSLSKIGSGQNVPNITIPESSTTTENTTESTEAVVEPEEDKAFLGISVLNDESAKTILGLRIAGVYENSPAAIAGLQAGDIIMTMDDVSIDSFDTLSGMIANKKPGDTVSIRYAHTQDNTVYFYTVEVKLTNMNNFEFPEEATEVAPVDP